MITKRRAKIVGTLGPSTDSIEILEQLIRSGMNVARLNMSHGTHEQHKKMIENVRAASKRCNREVAILCDLQGPKIRVSKLKEPLQLKKGERWLLGYERDLPKEGKVIPTTYENIVPDAVAGARILFDDGLLEAKVLKKDSNSLEIEIIEGGTLKSNKGINLPDINVSAPSLTDKDEEDLLFGLKYEVDYVAISFVRTAEDIQKVKNLIHKQKEYVPIVAKIEKPEAIENIDAIIDVTDVIMIARGDMGVELGNHLVPQVQKELIAKCNSAGVPVITATQMLESMQEHSRPTRAEASDVANAIWDGTDAVMLSGETAAGKYPVETVQMMDQIVHEAEKHPKERPLLRYMNLSGVSSSIQVAASLIAEKNNARCILSFTESGNSCLQMTRFRPKRPVLGVTPSLRAIRRMCLYWGITPYHVLRDHGKEMLEMETEIITRLKDEAKLVKGDKIVITHGGGLFFKDGTANTIRVEIVQDS